MRRRPALGHVGYFAELIDEWAPEAHADERLYRLGSAMVDALSAGAPIERLARYFEYWLLRLQGVYPSFNACPGCGTAMAGAVMPPREDMYVCVRCAPSGSGTHLGGEALQFLRASGRTAPEKVDSLTLDARARARARDSAPAVAEHAPGKRAEVGSCFAGDGTIALAAAVMLMAES